MPHQDPYFNPFQKSATEVAERLDHELAGLRTNRATPMLIENIHVQCYGVKTPLLEVASISVADPRTLVVQPWDSTVVKDIERSLIEVQRGFSVSAEGKQLRISLAPLTEENRRELSKVVKGKLEEAKISLRKLRDKIREQITSQEKNQTLSQDDRYRLQKNLDAWISDMQKTLEQKANKKELDIMTV